MRVYLDWSGKKLMLSHPLNGGKALFVAVKVPMYHGLLDAGVQLRKLPIRFFPVRIRQDGNFVETVNIQWFL